MNDDNDGGYPCPGCGFVARRPQELADHLIDTGHSRALASSGFQCQDCLFVTDNAAAMAMHLADNGGHRVISTKQP